MGDSMYDGELRFKSNGDVWPLKGGRPHGVFARFSDAELAYIDELCAVLGVRRSALLYAAVLFWQPAPKTPSRVQWDVRATKVQQALSADLGLLLPRLGRVSGNLNQIARTANTNGWADRAELEFVQTILATLIEDVRRAVGRLR
ncbi:plasmid mobilization relaxosome protein MobC [Pseudonocardiaceae bacterium YIM PH 21723]|nr:plasmid mobilization relaxosome protein MobC [Pseudonocardiaceae bacterium YIM PH 21723]